jgi:hypothetical protein
LALTRARSSWCAKQTISYSAALPEAEIRGTAMQHALEQADAGHGQVVALVGEPGVGKSRAVYEFVRSYHTSMTCNIRFAMLIPITLISRFMALASYGCMVVTTACTMLVHHSRAV